MEELENFLKEALIFQNIIGVNESFDFKSRRNYFFDKKNSLVTDGKDGNLNKKISSNKQQISKNNNIATTKIKEDTTMSTNEGIKTTIKVGKKNNTDILSKITTFDDLEKEIQNFNGCDIRLCAKNTVIFDGNKEAKIMLIGEAPGETEDLEGKPFCGQSGKLLRKALDFINLNTNNLLITNTVYWRPPGNRKPTEEELNICEPFLLKMIQIVKPKIIILCGATAIESILKIKPKMSEVAGTIKTIDVEFEQSKLAIKTFSIYHPSFLLRQPSMKKIFWEHLLKLENEIKTNMEN